MLIINFWVRFFLPLSDPAELLKLFPSSDQPGNSKDSSGNTPKKIILVQSSGKQGNKNRISEENAEVPEHLRENASNLEERHGVSTIIKTVSASGTPEIQSQLSSIKLS